MFLLITSYNHFIHIFPFCNHYTGQPVLVSIVS